MGIPTTPLKLMNKVYKDVFPVVQKELHFWKSEAMRIPDPELRKQALDSIENKDFHCEGGAILSLLAEDKKNDAITFIVAYQTISDYLDNLCDRSTSLDDKDFAALHEAMIHSLKRESEKTNYYRLRKEQDDGGYLHKLVSTCQSFLRKLDHYDKIASNLLELCQYYSDLQVHKHVQKSERVERLQKWFSVYEDQLPEMSWYEFSACSGSTLGIFCLISYALRDDFKVEHAEQIRNGYFPYIQGLHILLDYFIDQQEDLDGGDLNFCFYYGNNQELFSRMSHFISKAEEYLDRLPHKQFHKLIHRGLLGLYLSDEKVEELKETKVLAKKMVKLGGKQSRFFYVNAKIYRRIKKIIPEKFVTALSR
ncbi:MULTISPECIES: tetraprenyl-beta-curcumene synthase family protein [Bacillus]|uniref:tetraprenyl-beta-curcumene synthase family protein n=1 Tax=Bacillus TaxID=1386 RepID=UPI000315DAD4|nr:MULTISPECIES: tetraprenyl-beta-curcumene synthase family protein [Bacillus]